MELTATATISYTAGHLFLVDESAFYLFPAGEQEGAIEPSSHQVLPEGRVVFPLAQTGDYGLYGYDAATAAIYLPLVLR